MKQSFTDDVREQVKRKARRDMVVAAAGDRLAFVRSLAGQTFAWLRIAKSLDDLARDPVVVANQVAVEFVQAVRALVDGALLADDARQVLEPVDELLPLGSKGVKFKPHGSGEGPLKRLIRRALPPLERRLKRKASAVEVWNACAVKPGRGLDFISTSDGSPDHVWIADRGTVTWASFRRSLSEVRRAPA